jgi:hypothetical protein
MRAGVTSHNQPVANLNERNVNTARGANRDTSGAASRQLLRSPSVLVRKDRPIPAATQVTEGLFSPGMEWDRDLTSSAPFPIHCLKPSRPLLVILGRGLWSKQAALSGATAEKAVPSL